MSKFHRKTLKELVEGKKKTHQKCGTARALLFLKIDNMSSVPKHSKWNYRITQI